MKHASGLLSAVEKSWTSTSSWHHRRHPAQDAAQERAALLRLLERAGDMGLRDNINFA